MFYGFTESESFADPTILNQFKQHKVVIEDRGGGKGYWHIVILSIDDSNIENAVDIVSKNLKPDWNAMFYNQDTLYAVFKDKIFKLKMKVTWQLSDYEEVKKYAKDCDVGDLDMNEVFDHYKKLLS
jgi:hypothetical protein